ncbi:MAG: cysteine desulfurase family protein [Candidatus Omnitrophota bacterium]
MDMVYLDANATTPIHPEVFKVMIPFYVKDYGNASSLHFFGRQARQALDKARFEAASFMGADLAEEIIFTSGGTESDNLAIMGAARILRDKGRHIVTSSVEHPAVLNVCKKLETKGYEVTYVGVDSCGMIDLQELKKSLRDDTILISIMAANNETGTMMPINEIGKIAEQKDIMFHVDAVQVLGKIPFNVKKNRVHLASVSSHKINGPKGVGALYIKKGTEIDPCQLGGHQEKGLRPGTENVSGIAGFGKACQIAENEGFRKYKQVKVLRDKLYNGIKETVSSTRLNGHVEKRLPNTVNISFAGVEGEAVVLGLDIKGIAVSTGSACASGLAGSSHVLKSMGLEDSSAQSAIRFSLNIFNTEKEIEYVIAVLPQVIEKLRKISAVRI